MRLVPSTALAVFSALLATPVAVLARFDNPVDKKAIARCTVKIAAAQGDR